MRRLATVLLTVACIGVIGIAAAWTGGPNCAAKKAAMAKAGGSCSAKSAAASACSADKFPTMAMFVADKRYECPQAAEKAAKDAHAKIVYAVGEKKFDDVEEAYTFLADESETFVKHFTTIACVIDGKIKYCDDSCDESAKSACSKDGARAKTASADGKACSKADKQTVKTASSEGKACCKSGQSTAKVASGEVPKGCCKSGKAAMAAKLAAGDSKECCMSAKNAKFMVLGRTFDSYQDAAKARDEAIGAVRKVKMTYLVDGKEVSCSSEVCPMAKKAGKVKYVVGKEQTSCEIMARINLARSQFEAAKGQAQKLASAA